jgi:hypothetical protein
MRMTIVKQDKFISIDGNGLLDIQQDFSWIPDDVTAVQWYNNKGEVEYIDNRPNLEITELGIYEKAIEMYQSEKKRLEEELINLENLTDYWELLRDERNNKLVLSDWTQLPDVNLTEEEKELWRIYRQELRDLLKNIEDPKPLVLDLDHKDWPIPPQ